jgi:hypothetical protein
MKTWLLYAIVASLLTLLLFAGIHVYLESQASSKQPDIFFGVDAAYDNVDSLKARVDEVKGYTNFFIIGSYGITFNETRLNDMCQYIYDSGLSFAIFAHTLRGTNITFDQAAWTHYAAERWGERFWGLYAYDEPGGHQVDRDSEFMAVREADNYSDAASKFVEKLSSDALVDFIPLSSPLITSDYALYEFDYRAGYDVVMAELAWNHSRPINIALCRGAATVHGKDWGVMITYTYTTPPYLASGPQIYDDLVLAYENGAKYFMVFDYAKDPDTGVTHGLLQPEHLDAMQRFWDYVKHNPRPEVGERVTYVLPKDYAFGFRGPADSIWGLWGPDELSGKVWTEVNALAEQHGEALDIIYEDALQNHGLPYNKAVIWNGTMLMH